MEDQHFSTDNIFLVQRNQYQFLKADLLLNIILKANFGKPQKCWLKKLLLAHILFYWF